MQSQEQFHCRECGKLTLHVREIEGPNHVVHGVITLLLCGCWLPVWLLLAVSPTVHPYRCAVCGMIPGELTAEDLAKKQIRQIEAERRMLVASDKRIVKRQAATAERRKAVRGFVLQIHDTFMRFADGELYFAVFYELLIAMVGLALAGAILHFVVVPLLS